MAKRFVDTEIFDDDWFMDLSKDAKLLWFYLITRCDHAGIFRMNIKLCKFHLGINDPLTVMEQLGNRSVRVRELLYFIPKFIEFQYPGFPKSNVKQQESAIKILEKYGIYSEGSLTVPIELTNTYGNGNGNKGGTGEEKKYNYNAFYDKQIELSEGSPEYLAVVKILFGQNALQQPLKSVLSLRDQLTYEQFKTLYEYKLRHKIIFSPILEDMENWDGLKNKKSVSLTFLTFMHRRHPEIKEQ